MNLRYIPQSGFMARGGQGPRRDNPRDWVAWHFTHRDNLKAICRAGRLLPATSVKPVRNVANPNVKERRTWPVEPDPAYPQSSVHDHVPFYLTAKSPMLYVVTQNDEETYRAKSADLVFLGVALGDVIDSGATWCMSDGNAASAYTQFSRDVDALGDFVDFDLLCRKMWNNTADDSNRQGRRGAELLVLKEVPLQLVSVVLTRNEPELGYVQECFGAVRGQREYHAMTAVFYN